MDSGYSVGGLQISFEALDKTSSVFNKLKRNLEAIKEAIKDFTSIDSKSLDTFGKNIDALTDKLSPLLNKFESASSGVLGFNSAVRSLRTGNLTEAAKSFEQISIATQEANEGLNKIKQDLVKPTEQQPIVSQKEVKTIGEIEIGLAKLKAELAKVNILYAEAYSSKDLHKMEEYGGKLSDLKGKVSELNRELREAQKISHFTPFDDAKKEISNLNNVMLNLAYSKVNLNTDDLSKALDLTKRVEEAQETVKKAMMTNEELVVYEYQQAEAAKRKEIAYLQAALALDKAGDKTEEYKQRLKELTETEKESEKATKKNNLSIFKLFASIKRVAVYRLIRGALKAITSSFSETIQAYAEIDDGVNNTMSSIISSANVIKLSFGTSLIPLLNSIEPIINSISVSFANFANTVNASLSKTGEFTKINVKALIDYREQLSKKGGLLDIDKFSSLNRGSSLSDFLEPNSKVSEFNKELENTSGIYTTIAETVKQIGDFLGNAISAIKSIASSLSPIVQPVLTVAGALLSVVSSLLKTLDNLGLIEPLVYSILGYIGAIGATKIVNWFMGGSFIAMFKKLTAALTITKKGMVELLATQQATQIAVGALAGAMAYFISSLDDLSSDARAGIPILSAFLATIAGIAVANAAAAAHIAAPAMAGITAAALVGALTLVSSTAISKALGFANGGLPQAGTMFYAGESGAEFVYNMPSGQTGVANIDQIETAMYNALVRYGRNNTNGSGAVDVYIDGEKVFQATRRRANSKGLDFSRK